MAVTSVLGIVADGVGTQALLTRDGEVVARFTEGPLNVLLDPDALDKLAALIREAEADAVGVGLAGLRGANQANLLQMQLRSATGVPVTVGDDTEVAQLGAFEGGPGIVVIAHTGSNSLGRNAAGRTARAGGYGHVVGDEGSHYWIAAQGIRAALRSGDGRGAKSKALEDAVRGVYGVDLDAVMRRVTEASADPGVVSRAATAIMAVDDAVVRPILERAADDLVMHVTALRATLGELPVAMSGAIFEHPVIRQRFVAATGAVDVASTPVFGAVVLGSSPGAQRDMGWSDAA